MLSAANVVVVGLVSCSTQNDGFDDWANYTPSGGTPSTGQRSIGGTLGNSERNIGGTSNGARLNKGNSPGVSISGVVADDGSGAQTTANPADSLNACAPQPDDSGCVGAAFEGETGPLDILVMFDLSCSMSCTVSESGCCLPANANVPDTWRIKPVRSAMRDFLQDPASAGIGVGLGFFGNHPLLSFLDPVVCSVSNYSTPKVEIAPLPDNATALMNALEAGMPEGGTPTHLAISGACIHATDWTTSNPGRKVVILLVTDGIPELSCGATIQQAVSAAANCYNGGQGFQTYVLGISASVYGLGNSLTQLNQIAAAGGTQQAYLTDTTDVAASVLAALNAIRADAVIPCDLAIPKPPPGQIIAPDKINIGICSPGSRPIVSPYVRDASGCGNNAGWYYNDPNAPTTIHLCDATCQAVSETGSTLFFSVGCTTKDSTLIL